MPDGSSPSAVRVYRRDADGRFARGPVRVPSAAAATPAHPPAPGLPADRVAPVAAAYQRYTAAASTSVDTNPITLLDVNGTARRVAPGDLDDARWHLTMGNCHSFAAALHQRTGLPIVVFRALGDEDEEDDGYGHITHVGVATPDGYLLDAHGRALISEVEDAELVEADILPDGVPGLLAEIDHDTAVLGRRWQPLDAERVASFVDPLLAQVSQAE